jgi:hypothetical protein
MQTRTLRQMQLIHQFLQLARATVAVASVSDLAGQDRIAATASLARL